MCCGKGRQQVTATGPMPSGNGRVHSGSMATRLVAPPIARSSTAILSYQYVGRTGLTVVSPATGRQYRFDRPGSVVQVDARDRQWIERVPNVKPTSRRSG